ncbi:1860_t:CDS:2 [Scutellospora calospora]|uniref:1860_t:CDS:1 n=1 Tax=Scutellospora calospora TaxID=85575 RepID=A0ACA9KU39_9GLOM|nr:1860_t:CDS:2 [Scutellospora calospora]
MSTQPLLPKRIALPVRVEPKVFFANERTFLSWLQFTVVLGGLAIGLLNFGDKVGRISAALFTAVAMLIMMYALFIYHWRAAKIRRKEHGPYDDRYGPTFLCLFLVDPVTLTVTTDTSPTTANPSENIQLIEELKKPRRVLKTHNKFHEPERLVPPSEHEPTSTLYIKNFVRPLTFQMVRELLQQFGEIEYFWMDKIKSYCYVQACAILQGLFYKALASAINARQSLWHVTFPAETGRPLELEYLTPERARELIADAEAKILQSTSHNTRPNGKNNTTTTSNVRQNVNRVAPELLFPRTNAKPPLFYKTVSQEDAEARIQIMERRRGRNRT